MKQVPCTNCGGMIDVPTPKLELINQYTFSAIFWAHGEPVACANCGTSIIGVIPQEGSQGIKLNYMVVPSDGKPVVTKAPSRIINPFNH